LRNFLPPKVVSSLLKKGMGMSTFKRMHTAGCNTFFYFISALFHFAFRVVIKFPGLVFFAFLCFIFWRDSFMNNPEVA
jgi:hypothetical protein